MPTTVGILTFISRLNLMLSYIEHEKKNKKKKKHSWSVLAWKEGKAPSCPLSLQVHRVFLYTGLGNFCNNMFQLL